MNKEKRSYNADYSELYEDDTARCLSKLIIVLNIIFVIMGACILAMGLYITLDPDFKQWVNGLDLAIYWRGVYILIAAGVLVMFISFFGICGAFMKVRILLYIMIVLMAIAMIIEIAGSAYLLDHGLKGSRIEPYLRNEFYKLISEQETNPESQRIMNIVQEWVGCCGVDGVLDYVNWNKVIPSTCFDPIKGNAWYKQGYGYVGCVRGFTEQLEDKTGWIASLSLFTALMQGACIFTAVWLIRVKSSYKE